MTTDRMEEGLSSDLLNLHVEEFLGQLRTSGYAEPSIRRKHLVVSAFARWVKLQQIAVDRLSDSDIVAFVQRRRTRVSRKKVERVALGQLLLYLRTKSVVKTLPAPITGSPTDDLEQRYTEYLLQGRGLTENSRRVYVPLIRGFLACQTAGGSGLPGASFDAQMIRNYLLLHSVDRSSENTQILATALRSFFHFLFLRGDTPVDLAVSVPTVRTWRQASVPAFLPPEDVELVLRATDLSTSRGRRDHAILLLLSRLGLRAGEIVSLELGDLRWRSGEIVVRGKSRVAQHLPLLAEIGEALVLYIRQDRGTSLSRQVFVRMHAPRIGLAGPAAVGKIVRLAFVRAGLRPSSRGAAHLFRHGLATTMIRRGASMAEIAEVLRHRSQNTTAIYAKVSFESLRGVARPWPAAGGVQ